MRKMTVARAISIFGVATATATYISPTAEASVIDFLTVTRSPGSAQNYFPFPMIEDSQNVRSPSVYIYWGLGDFDEQEVPVFGGLYDWNSQTIPFRFASEGSIVSNEDSFPLLDLYNTPIGQTRFFGFRGPHGVGWLKSVYLPETDNFELSGAYEDSWGPIRVGATAQVPAPVPEPASLALTAFGLLAAGAIGKLRQKRKAAA